MSCTRLQTDTNKTITTNVQRCTRYMYVHTTKHTTATNAAEDDMFAVLLAVHLPGNSPQGTNYPGQHPPHTTTTPLWLSQCPLVQCAVGRSECTVYSVLLAVHDMQCAASILCSATTPLLCPPVSTCAVSCVCAQFWMNGVFCAMRIMHCAASVPPLQVHSASRRAVCHNFGRLQSKLQHSVAVINYKLAY